MTHPVSIENGFALRAKLSGFRIERDNAKRASPVTRRLKRAREHGRYVGGCVLRSGHGAPLSARDECLYDTGHPTVVSVRADLRERHLPIADARKRMHERRKPEPKPFPAVRNPERNDESTRSFHQRVPARGLNVMRASSLPFPPSGGASFMRCNTSAAHPRSS